MAAILVGYAVRFDEPSADLGGFIEVIKRQAMQRTIDEQIDLRALWNHDAGKVLGRLSAQTLAVSVDDKGLAIAVELSDSPLGKDAEMAVRRQDVDAMSFAFVVPSGGDTWTLRADGMPLRTIWDMRVFEVSAVSWAAYPSTSVSVRGATPAPARVGGIRRTVKKVIRDNEHRIAEIHEETEVDTPDAYPHTTSVIVGARPAPAPAIAPERPRRSLKFLERWNKVQMMDHERQVARAR